MPNSTSFGLKTCIFLTLSYPFDLGKEETFLAAEVNSFSSFFDTTVVIPSAVGGKLVELPDNCVLDLRYATENKRLAKKHKLVLILKGLTLRSYYIELLRSLNNNFSIKTCVDLAILIGRIKCQSKVLGNIISKLPNQDIVCYTFWFRNETSALAQIPKRNFKLITRAHGADVYIERSKLNLYYREQTLANLDKVFCVSEAGKRYLQDQFPKYKDKFVTRYLGSVPHDFKSEHSDESNTIRFVSCSSVIGLKRVDLIFEFLSTLANLKSQYRIVWNHIGDGELMDSLKQMTESKPENIEVHFHGHKENRLILEFYRDNKIDLFIHLSSTEGLPVVIMEALSFGIPVIATDVGGVSEIVNSKTGYLLSQNPSFEEVLEKVNDYLALSPDQTKNMRSAIRHFWLDKLNAETNARSHISSFK